MMSSNTLSAEIRAGGWQTLEAVRGSWVVAHPCDFCTGGLFFASLFTATRGAKGGEFASSRARRRTFRIPPFQQKRDAGTDENEWPDPKRVDVNDAPTCEQEHDASDQKYRAGDCAMIGAIPNPVSEAADGHGEQAGSR